MGQKRTEGYSDRIKEALDHGPRPMRVRALATALAGAHGDIRGTSYGGVRSYVEGRVRNPRMEMLRAIAEALDVRDAWLCYNEGEMTHEQQALLERRESVRPGTDEISKYAKAVVAGLRPLRGGGPVAPDDYPVIEVFNTLELYRGARPGRGYTKRIEAEAARVSRAFLAPLEELGIPLQDIPVEGWTDYTLAMSAALRGMIRISSPNDAGRGTRREANRRAGSRA